MQCSHAVISTRGDPPRGLRDSLHRPEPKRDRREISLNRPPTQTPQAGRQDRSAASCDDRRRRNPVVRPSIHPKPSKVMESEIRENHQVFRRVQVGEKGAASHVSRCSRKQPTLRPNGEYLIGKTVALTPTNCAKNLNTTKFRQSL